MHIATLGDISLDVVVELTGTLHEDDDTEALISLHPGGQAANVAAWAASLGAAATTIGPLDGSATAALLHDQLTTAGVHVNPVGCSAPATVVSILDVRGRTLASDAGDQAWLASVTPGALPADADWLHISAYPLLRADDPAPVLRLIELARGRAVAISLDLSSASLIAAFGPQRFCALLAQIEPDVVFANSSEWAALELTLEQAPNDVVVKQGAEGVALWAGGRLVRHAARPTEVVDVTGAGDALAAGYLVGGIDLALTAAARCIARRGAQPLHSRS